MSTLSIIVPVHNSKSTLEECLNAILSSDYTDYELIVVDDASTDGSAQIAGNFPCRITGFRSNRGAAAARNRGALKSSGQIILFIDSDVIVKSDSLQKIVSEFSKHYDITGISGVYSIKSRFNNFLSQYKHLVVYYRERMCEDISQDSFKTAFVAIRREVFQKYKFDESIKNASTEDMEFGRKLIALGYIFALDKSNEVEHLKEFTVRTFIKNQYQRSKDIVKTWLGVKSYKFYLSRKRKNKYAKRYILRVPITWLAIFIFGASFVVGNGAIFLIPFLLLFSIFLEKEFLAFCLIRKGLVFTVKCILIYFVDGFFSGIGILSGGIEMYTEKLK